MPSKENEKLIKLALKRFESAQQAESSNRERATSDDEFAAGHQWTQVEINQRNGSPVLTINRIAGTLKQIRGDQRKSKPSIKIRPVDGASDPQVAKILQGIIKNIESTSDAESAWDTAFDQAIEGGWGYFRINTGYTDDDVFEQDITIERIVNRFAVHFDPSYIRVDASDAQYCFISEFLSKEEFDEQYPDFEDSPGVEWDQDRGQENENWFTEEGIRVAEYWYKKPVTRTLYQLDSGDVVNDEIITAQSYELIETEQGLMVASVDEQYDETGKPLPMPVMRVTNQREVQTHQVMWCKMTGSEVLEKPVEWPGKYIPIVIVMGEEKFDKGERKLYSATYHARDAQRVYNLSVSTQLETMSLAPKQPWLVTAEQIAGLQDYWNNAHRYSMPYLPYNHAAGQPSPVRQDGSAVDSGADRMSLKAADDIKSTTGIFDASLGARSNEVSGVAIQRRQLEGDMAAFVFQDNLMKALKYAGKIIIDLIPYIYDTERVVRILGPDGVEQFVTVNQVAADEQGSMQTINDVTQGKYDVVVDIGPAFASQRSEAVQRMVEFIKVMPQLAPMLIDLVAKNADWPGADEIYERLQQMNQQQEQQGQQPDPEQQLELAKGQQEIVKGQQEIQKSKLDLVLKQLDIAGKADQMDMNNEAHIMKVTETLVQQAMQQDVAQAKQTQTPKAAPKSSSGNSLSGL
jgi:hypothetical protein